MPEQPHRKLPKRSTRPIGSLAERQKIIPAETRPQLLHRSLRVNQEEVPTTSLSKGLQSAKPKKGSKNLEELHEQEHERRERVKHRVLTFGKPRPCPQDGYQEVDAVQFVVRPETDGDKSIKVKTGDWVIAEVETFGKNGEVHQAQEVALVLAVLQDQVGEVVLAVRWCWSWNSIFFGAEGKEALSNPRQIFLQRNVCKTSNVDQGPVRVQFPDGSFKDLCPWGAVEGLATVKHRSQINDLKAYCAKSASHFFYDKEFDNSAWRISQIGPVECSSEKPFKRLDPSELTMGDMFSGLGTVALGAVSAGMKAQYCVEVDDCAFNAAYLNLNGKLKLEMPLSVEQFIQGIREKRPGYPQRGDVAVLHLSPPCQSLSRANRHASLKRVEEELYPILEDCVKLVKLLKPKFVTIEEVPQFLVTSFPLATSSEDASKSMTVIHPGLRILAPLIDYKYQAEISILNSIFYGVPQHRKRAFVFLALPGYELPSAPAARYHFDLLHSQHLHRTFDTMRRDLMHWDSVYLTSGGTLENLCDLKAGKNAASVDFGEAAEQQLKAALKEETGCGEEEEKSEIRAKVPANLLNPRRLPLVPTASLALDDLGVPRIADNKAATFCKSRYRNEEPYTCYAAFCRTPLVRKERMSVLEDHNIALRNIVPKHGAVPKEMGVMQRAMYAVRDKNSLRTDPDGIFQTICTMDNARSMKSCMHHRELRLLTLAERKRIQSIPDDVHLIGDEPNKSRQVGNAVPFLMARAVMDAVYEAATGLPPKKFPQVAGLIGHDDESEKENNRAAETSEELGGSNIRSSYQDCEMALSKDTLPSPALPASNIVTQKSSGLDAQSRAKPLNPFISVVQEKGWSVGAKDVTVQVVSGEEATSPGKSVPDSSDQDHEVSLPAKADTRKQNNSAAEQGKQGLAKEEDPSVIDISADTPRASEGRAAKIEPEKEEASARIKRKRHHKRRKSRERKRSRKLEKLQQKAGHPTLTRRPKGVRQKSSNPEDPSAARTEELFIQVSSEDEESPRNQTSLVDLT